MDFQDVVTKFKARVNAALAEKLVAVYWFGSTARNNASNESDIDILIETTSTLTRSERDQVTDIVIDLCAETNTVLDIHYYTAHELNTAPFSYSPFIDTVKREAIKV